jgi:hypothetical protein
MLEKCEKRSIRAFLAHGSRSHLDPFERENRRVATRWIAWQRSIRRMKTLRFVDQAACTGMALAVRMMRLALSR